MVEARHAFDRMSSYARHAVIESSKARRLLFRLRPVFFPICLRTSCLTT